MPAPPKRKLCLEVVEGQQPASPKRRTKAAFFSAIPKQVIPLIRGVLVRLATDLRAPAGHGLVKTCRAGYANPGDPGLMR